MSTPLRRAGGGMLAAVMLGGLAVITPALTSVSLAAAPTVRQGAGTGDAVTVALDQFRADLGGGKTAGANGSFGGVRREINWDGVPDQFASPHDLPLDFFNTRSPRGAVFSTPGVSVLVSAKASVGKPRFGELNPTYAAEFSAFSPERIFTAVGSTVTEVSFFVPGTTTKGAVRGFGVMFTDVDSPESTKIELLQNLLRLEIGTVLRNRDLLIDGAHPRRLIRMTVDVSPEWWPIL